jgi:predicted dehydrogenase
LAYRYGDVTAYPLAWKEPLRAECLDFLACIEAGRPACSDGRMGLKVVQILETAQRSLNNGGTKELIQW